MQFLNHLDFSTSAILALLLGSAFAHSLLHQIKLQRLAQENSRNEKAKIWERITFAGLSFAILFAIIIAGKNVSALSYEYFMFVAAVSAIICLIYRWWKRNQSVNK